MALTSSLGKFLPHILLPLVVLVFCEAAPIPGAVRMGLEEGNRAQAENQPGLAAARFLQVVEQEPWRVEIWEDVGRARLAQGNQVGAVEAMRNAWNAGALSREGSYLLAGTLEARSEWENAREVWEALAQTDPDDAQVYPHLTALYRRSGDLDRAVAAARSWQALQPQDPQASYQLGLVLAADHTAEALTHLEQAAALDPAYLPARDAISRAAALAWTSDDPAYGYTLVGRELAGLGAWDLAERAFLQAVEANPGYAEAWAFLGEAREQMGKDGLEALKQAEATNPGSVLAQALLALYWARAGGLDQALIHLEAAAALEPERGVWQLELGSLTARKGDLQAAREYYQAAAALEPENAQMWVELARFSVSYNLDIRGLGLSSARTAYQLAPEDAGVLDVMGTVFLSLGDATTAERFLQRALKQEPEFAAAHLHLGQMFLIRDEVEKAQEYLIRAAQLDPDGEIGQIARRLLEQQFSTEDVGP